MAKKLPIRNSTAEFLIFKTQSGKDTIDVRIENENVWLTQKLTAKLFGVEVNTINYHLKEIFNSGELNDESTVRKFRIVQKEGNREVSRDVEHYNLEAIIAVGFRVNSQEATNFRRWANKVLKDFALKGYVLDDVRLKNRA
ncbi:MAG: RhuM family protein [Bacteroidales bacterium]